MIRLELRGASTHLHSTLCARCPTGSTGCCATPPGFEWSDLGRIVLLGGRSFLLQEIAAGRLYHGRRGLLVTRVVGPEGPPHRCAFHGPAGCTIPPDRRAATCNYYVCEDAFVHAGNGPQTHAARAALARLEDGYGRWDRAMAKRIEARWPTSPPWDEPFLDWLGAAFQHASREPGADT